MSHCPPVRSRLTQGQTGRPQGSPLHLKREMGVGIGRATTRAHPPHPLPARPYYTANRPAKAVYRRGRGGCGLVAARPCYISLINSVLTGDWEYVAEFT